MQRIAKFEKVSFEQFKKDWQGEHPQDTDDMIKEIYDGIRLPKRATAGSAGYDFFAPAAFTLKPGQMTKILTGIRARIDDGWVLKLYPRSGLGFKFRLQLNNTVGIIDSDYYGSDNEGHIQVKLTNKTSGCARKKRPSVKRRPEPVFPREFLWSTASRWMTRPMK